MYSCSYKLVIVMYINCIFCILHIIVIFAYYFLAWYIQTMYSEVSYTACMDGKCGRDGASYTTEVKLLLYCEVIPHGSDPLSAS